MLTCAKESCSMQRKSKVTFMAPLLHAKVVKGSSADFSRFGINRGRVNRCSAVTESQDTIAISLEVGLEVADRQPAS